MAGIFKAYDVRGIYPEQINEDMARQIGRTFYNVLEAEGFPNGKSVIVGHDMRSHSLPIEEALVDGLTTAGLDVIRIGLVTTPMCYYAVGSLKVAGGVQVTASHNPAKYNGLKFSLDDARPVSGSTGIALMEKDVAAGNLPQGTTRGSVSETSVTQAFEDHILSFLKRPEGARRLKVVVDAANGMGCLYQSMLEKMGIDLIPLYFELDGTFPNHEANPLRLENLRDLAEKVKETGADLGVSFDGDADRSAFVDENGLPVGSDIITALIGGELLERETGHYIVYDLRSSRAVAEYIEEKGGKPLKERVGHSFIKATMREHGSIFGGELAGHYYFRDHYTADASSLAVVEILNLIWKRGQTLSHICEPLYRYHKTPEINFKVEAKEEMMQALAEKYAHGEIDYLDGVTVNFPDWWFNVRPSNTEPYLRMVLEADTQEAMEKHRDEIVAMIGEPV